MLGVTAYPSRLERGLDRQHTLGRRAAGAILLIAVLGFAGCSDAPSPGGPVVGPLLLEGPLTLEIVAPDSSITERVLFPISPTATSAP